MYFVNSEAMCERITPLTPEILHGLLKWLELGGGMVGHVQNSGLTPRADPSPQRKPAIVSPV
jgi:hypothetical protein